MSNELFDALEMLEKEKGIKSEDFLASIQSAIGVAVKKYYGVPEENVLVEIDTEYKRFKASILKEVVEEITEPTIQVLFSEAHEKNRRIKLGATVSVKLDTKQIGRIAALAGKNLIHTAINDAVKAKRFEQYQSKLHEVVNAKVLRVETKTGNATITFEKNEAILFKNEQIPTETLKEGDNVKVYINDVVNTEKYCNVKVTRTHKDLVKRLFEMEVPEIFDGIVLVKAVSREPGSRTKMAVFSNDENVDARGACIGQKYSRVSSIVKELNGENIDIILYSEKPEEFIANALAPADVISVKILDEEEKVCRVIVPENQLSLAIGNKGQNAKLAARLTGFKIDIRSENSIDDEIEETEKPQEKAEIEE